MSRRTLCVRVVAQDSSAMRMVPSFPYNLRMSNGALYIGGLYSTRTSVNTTENMAPTVLDIGAVYDVDIVEREELMAGKWDNADVFVFMTDFDNPVEDEEEIKRFTLGKVREEDDRFTVELMSLLDKLNQQTGRTITPQCKWTFADEHIDGTVIASDKSRCGLTAASFIVTGAITSITDDLIFTDSSRAEDSDYFGNGEIRFTSGNNAGLSYRRISAFSSGQFTLQFPFYYTPEVGDAYTAIAGCRKRDDEDCRIKFSNKKRFGGFPDVPTTSQVSIFGNQT